MIFHPLLFCSEVSVDFRADPLSIMSGPMRITGRSLSWIMITGGSSRKINLKNMK